MRVIRARSGSETCGCVGVSLACGSASDPRLLSLRAHPEKRLGVQTQMTRRLLELHSFCCSTRVALLVPDVILAFNFEIIETF